MEKFYFLFGMWMVWTVVVVSCVYLGERVFEYYGLRVCFLVLFYIVAIGFVLI